MVYPFNPLSNIARFEALEQNFKSIENENIEKAPITKIDALHREAIALISEFLKQGPEAEELLSKVDSLEKKVNQLYLSKLSVLSDQLNNSDSLFQLVDIQDEVLNIFNNITTKPQEKSDETDKVLSFANKLLKDIENKQKVQVLNAPSMPSSFSLNDTRQTILKFDLAYDHTFFDKYVGAEPEMPISPKDISYLKHLLADIKLKISLEQDPARSEELVQLNRAITEIKTRIHNAVEKRLEVLEKLPPIMNLIEMRNGPITSEEKAMISQALVPLCHDFYWDFNTPGTICIDFANFIQILQDNPEMLTEGKLQHLQAFEAAHEVIYKFGRGQPTKYLSYDKFLEHKLFYIQSKRQEARQEITQTHNSPQKVIIAGGGPAGLIRGLFAAVNGHSVQIFEKRKDYTRENVIKLTDLEALRYFGIQEELIHQQKAYPGEEIAVAIKDIENVLKQRLNELMPTAIITDQELVDIRVGVVEGQRETGCLIKDKNGATTWHAANVIVDATGAREISSKRIGGEKQSFSQDRLRIAVAIRVAHPDPMNVGAFTTPSAEYAILEPVKELELLELWENIKSLTEESKGIEKILTDLKEDQLSTYMKGVFRDRLARRLKVKVNDPQLLKLAEDHIVKLSTKIKEAQKAYDALLREEITQYIKDNPHFVPSIHPDFVYDRDVILGAAFNVNVMMGMPTRKVGLSDVIKSGDSVVTPDPLSGTGAKTAIRGGAMFGQYLNERMTNPGKALTELDFGINRLNSQVLLNSLYIRGEEKKPLSAIVVNLRQAGALKEEEAVFLDLCLFKHIQHIPLTQSDKEKLVPLVAKVKKNISTLSEISGGRRFLQLMEELQT